MGSAKIPSPWLQTLCNILRWLDEIPQVSGEVVEYSHGAEGFQFKDPASLQAFQTLMQRVARDYFQHS